MNHESLTMRMLEYKNVLKRLKEMGFSKVFSTNLADSLDISASLVRKDFLTLTTSGNKRGGYQINQLLNEINKLLRKNERVKTVLVGAGKIGMALCNYNGFEEENIEISAAFDTDQEKLGQQSSVPIYEADKLTEYIMQHSIRVGILTLPGSAVQKIADSMVLAGVRGFLNFTPVRLVLPQECSENRINLAMELEKLIFQISSSNGKVVYP
ncbi:MAG: redox-sensing transcriptional repressor Rex [Chitinivibrionales bacterium]|nr:redox-sensing transcriptional repressor Rex [Chitinivibrionales bacterium]